MEPAETSGMQPMPDAEYRNVLAEFWHAYYSALFDYHLNTARKRIGQAVYGRNQITTNSQHVAILEQYWRQRLADGLGVSLSEVAANRKIRFRPHASKNFDVCWPAIGEPKIVISIKSMQNALRNMTNRVEEAFGDSGVLRLYRSKAAFGFFFCVIDGPVSRGRQRTGVWPKGEPGSAKPTKVKPILELVEHGGDLIDFSEWERYCEPGLYESHDSMRTAKAQDSIEQTTQRLLDLLGSTDPTEKPDIHYDAIGFAPICIEKQKPTPTEPRDWTITPTTPHPSLDAAKMIDKLLATARLRGLL